MEEKIIELEKRLAKLERIEKRRKSLLIVKIAAIILLVVAIVIAGYIAYRKVEDALKPYREFIKTTDKVNNGIDSIKDLFNKN